MAEPRRRMNCPFCGADTLSVDNVWCPCETPYGDEADRQERARIRRALIELGSYSPESRNLAVAMSGWPNKRWIVVPN